MSKFNNSLVNWQRYCHLRFTTCYTSIFYQKQKRKCRLQYNYKRWLGTSCIEVCSYVLCIYNKGCHKLTKYPNKTSKWVMHSRQREVATMFYYTHWNSITSMYNIVVRNVGTIQVLTLSNEFKKCPRIVAAIVVANNNETVKWTFVVVFVIGLCHFLSEVVHLLLLFYKCTEQKCIM